MSKKHEPNLEEQERRAAAADEAAAESSPSEASAAPEESPEPPEGEQPPEGEEQRPEGGEGAGENQAGAEAALEDQLTAAREESRHHYEKYLRAVADWENYRRRTAREKDELRQYAVGSFIEELLPVLDNLELGLQTAAKHPEAAMVTEGFQMVADQIRTLLNRHGLETVNPEGEAFDPHRHESVAYQPDPERPEGTVIDVVRRGYSLNGRLLRPASVVVSSGAPKEEESEAKPEENQ